MGGWFARRQNSTEAFFLGGRSVPWWAVGFSFFGSSISTGTFLAFPGQGYGGDWIPHLSHLIFPVIAVLAACWVIPYYRQRVRMSAYEFLEQRFGYGTRCYASLIYVLYHLFRNGMILFLMAKALNAMTGWDPVAILVVCGILALLYTMLGGLEAVIWTDVLQSVTLFGGGLFCLWFLTFGSDEGALHLFQVAGDAGKFKLVDWSLDLSHPTIVVIILYGLVHHGTYYTTSQDVAQRYLAASSTRSSQKALLCGGLSIVTTWTLFLLIGSLLYAYYQIHPGQLPAEISSRETQIFPFFVMNTIPPGITGLILAGMCAAAMSSLDTTINSLAMITVRDFYLHFRPRASDRRQLVLGRIASGFWGVLGIGSGVVDAGRRREGLLFRRHRELLHRRGYSGTLPAGDVRPESPYPRRLGGGGHRNSHLGLGGSRHDPGDAGRLVSLHRERALPLAPVDDHGPGKHRFLHRGLAGQFSAAGREEGRSQIRGIERGGIVPVS